MPKLRPWSQIEPELSRLSPDQQGDVRQAYLQAANDQGLKPQADTPDEASGLLSPKSALLGRITGQLTPNSAGQLAPPERPMDLSGAFMRGTQNVPGLKSSPLLKLAGVQPDTTPPPESLSGWRGHAEDTAAMLGGVVPAAGAAVLGRWGMLRAGLGRLALLAAPAVFGGEGALGEYQREKSTGEPVSPGRIAAKGSTTAAIIGAASLAGGAVEAPFAGSASPVVRGIGGGLATGAEAATFAGAGEAERAHEENASFDPELAKAAFNRMLGGFGVMRIGGQLLGGPPKLASTEAQNDPQPLGIGAGSTPPGPTAPEQAQVQVAQETAPKMGQPGPTDETELIPSEQPHPADRAEGIEAAQRYLGKKQPLALPPQDAAEALAGLYRAAAGGRPENPEPQEDVSQQAADRVAAIQAQEAGGPRTTFLRRRMENLARLAQEQQAPQPEAAPEAPAAAAPPPEPTAMERLQAAYRAAAGRPEPPQPAAPPPPEAPPPAPPAPEAPPEAPAEGALPALQRLRAQPPPPASPPVSPADAQSYGQFSQLIHEDSPRAMEEWNRLLARRAALQQGAPPAAPPAAQEPAGEVPPPVPPDTTPPAPPEGIPDPKKGIPGRVPRGKGEAPAEPGAPASRVQALAYRQAVDELDDRLRTGANAKGEPLARDVLDSIRRQREEYAGRVTQLGGEAPPPAPEPRVAAAPERAAPPPATAPEPGKLDPSDPRVQELVKLESRLDVPKEGKAPASARTLQGVTDRIKALRQELGLPPLSSHIEAGAAVRAQNHAYYQRLAREAPGEPLADPMKEEMRQRLGQLERQLPTTPETTAKGRRLRAEIALLRARTTAPVKGQSELAGSVPAPRDRTFERGALTLGKPKEVPYRLSDPKLEGMFGRPEKPGFVDRWRQRGANIRDTLGEVFNYEHMVRDDPQTRARLRKLLDSPQEARRYSTERVAKVLQGLDVGQQRGEYEQFRRLAYLNDFVERGNEGKALPGNASLDAVTRERDALMTRATPAVKAALEENRRMWGEVAQDQVQRGHLGPAVFEKQDYLPHVMADYADSLADRPGMPQRLKEPGRPWAQRAEGSQRPIQMDYLKVATDRLARIRIANDMDDFAADVLGRRDILPKLTDQERAQLFGSPSGQPLPGAAYEYKGQVYRAYQYRRGYQYAVPGSPVEQTILEPLEKSLERFHLIPENIANRLDALKTPPSQLRIMRAWEQAHGSWKRMLLDFQGLAYNVNNAVGDAVAAFSEDAGTLGTAMRVPTIWNAIVRHRGDPAFLDFLQKERIQDLTFFRTEMPGLFIQDPLLRFRPRDEQLSQLAPWKFAQHALERGMDIREQWLHVATALRNWERVQRGEQPTSRTIDVQGLPPVEAAGKIAREITVDYRAQSPGFRFLSTVTGTPFATWYVDAMRRLPLMFLRGEEKSGTAPLTGAVKMGALAGMLWYWNNQVQGDTEKKLPDYYRNTLLHFNSPERDPSDPQKRAVYSFQTGPDILPQVFGLDAIPAALTDLQKGDIKPPEFWRRVLNGATGGKGILELPEAQFLINANIPARMLYGLATNRDPFSQAPIVPPTLEGTGKGRLIQGMYLMNQLLPVLSVYQAGIQRAIKSGVATRPMFDTVQRYREGRIDLKQAASELGDRFASSLQGGPLAIGRGIGRHDVDTARTEESKQLDTIHAYENTRNEALSEVEDAFRRSRVENDPSILKDALDRIRQRGVLLSGDEVKSRLTSPRFQQELARSQMESATDPAERAKAKARMELFSLQRGQKLIGSAPKTAQAMAAREDPAAYRRRALEALQGMRQRAQEAR